MVGRARAPSRLLGLMLCLSTINGCQWILGIEEHHLGTVNSESQGGAMASTDTTAAGTTAQGGGGASASSTPFVSYCASNSDDFCEDFEGDSPNTWTAFDQSAAAAGTWSASSQIDPLGLTTQVLSQTSSSVGYHFYVPDSDSGGPWGDQSVTAWIRLDADVGDDNTKVGLCARFSGTSFDNLAGYCLFLRNDSAANGYVQVSKKVAFGIPTNLGGVRLESGPFATATWFKVTLECIGATPVELNGYINDTAVVSLVDDSAAISEGSLGLVTRTGTAASSPGLGSFDEVTTGSR